MINPKTKAVKMKFYTIIFLSILILNFSGCTEDLCEGLNCENGVCEPIVGKCICIDGYQTDSSGICTVQWSAKFIGIYNAFDSCTGTNSGSQSYQNSLTALSSKQLSIDSMKHLNSPILARLYNSTSFSIDTIFSPGTVITGNGIYTDSNIVINYIVNDTINNLIDTCQTLLTK